jgi:DNA-binding winged helix-turn-helix (wHTH) protein
MKVHEKPASLVRFGPFTANLHSGELWRDGVRIRLQIQPFEVLRTFLERPDELITREELQNKIWPSDTFVDFDQGLNKAVNKLRDALHDSADRPQYIETIPRRGYRFIAPVVVELPVATEPVVASVEPKRFATRPKVWALALTAGVLLTVLFFAVFENRSVELQSSNSIAGLPLLVQD